MKELFLALEDVGKPQGLGYFGAYAMNSMRIEKGYRAWGGDFTTERTPAETGAGFLIKMDHEFIGRSALAERMAAEDRWEMVLLDIDGDGDIDPFYAHGVVKDDRVIGIVTSAAFGHRTGKTLALAYLRDRNATEGLSVEILGRNHDAKILEKPPFDPANMLLKAVSSS